MGSRLYRLVRRALAAVALFAVALVAFGFAVRQPADPALYPAAEGGVRITVVDHGYHAGLVLPRGALDDIAAREGLAKLRQALGVFSAFDHVEIGWGEERFYRHVPAADLSAAPHVLRALFNPWNTSVLHVVGVNGDPAAAFGRSAPLQLNVSVEGLRRMAMELDRQLVPSANGDVAPQGPGLYGPSAFFAARDRYHLFNTCNHWAGRTLALAGVPYSPVESTLSAGLMLSLRRGDPRSSNLR
ncbi:MAG: DUF2459 domain-containing protein [Beijerinckiaceae bacterium]